MEIKKEPPSANSKTVIVARVNVGQRQGQRGAEETEGDLS